MNKNVSTPTITELRSKRDEELLELMALHQNDELAAKVAFQVFYERYESYLFGIARNICSKFPRSANELFEAVFQNTFLKAYYSAATFDVSKVKAADISLGVKAWLGRIADNEHKQLLGKLVKEPFIQLIDDIPISDEELEWVPVEEISDEPDSYHRMVLEQALSTLSEKERYILVQSTAYEKEGKYLPNSFINSTCKLWQITRANFRKIKSTARQKLFAKVAQILALKTD